LLEEGKSQGIRPCGLGARDTLRLEAGMRLYGNDMDVSTNPFEAGLDWAVDLEKDFIGADPIRRAESQGVSRTFVGLRMLDRNIPRHGYRVLKGGQPVGTVASGNVSFTLGYNIGTAYVGPDLSQPGTLMEVEVRGTAAPAQVVPLPFYSRKKQSA
jgi:aminomethyltransferase